MSARERITPTRTRAQADATGFLRFDIVRIDGGVPQGAPQAIDQARDLESGLVRVHCPVAPRSPGVAEAFARAQSVDIVVSSLAQVGDDHGLLNRFYATYGEQDV